MKAYIVTRYGNNGEIHLWGYDKRYSAHMRLHSKKVDLEYRAGYESICIIETDDYEEALTAYLLEVV